MSTITARRAGVAVAAIALLVLGFLWGNRTGSSSPARSTGPTALAGLAPVAATGQATDGGATGINVTGTGTVSGTPDALLLQLGVQVTGATVQAALDSANRAAATVQKSLREHGVADRDLQTSDLSIQPQTATADTRTTITGYQVEESLSATLRSLGSAGAAISAAAAAGGDATRIQSVGLDLTDSSALVSAARDRAFAQAKNKAEQYAKAAGVKLGAVLGISESVAGPVPMADRWAAPKAAAAGAVPIAAGSQQVTVSTSVVFGFN